MSEISDDKKKALEKIEQTSKLVHELRTEFEAEKGKTGVLVTEKMDKITESLAAALKESANANKKYLASEKRSADLDTKISEFEKRVSEFETKINRPDFNSNDKTNSDEEKQLACFFDAVRSNAPEKWLEYRALANYPSGADMDGGYYIPVQFEKMLMKELLDASVMRSLCSVSTIKTDKAEFGGMTRPGVTWGPGDYVFTDIAFDTSQMGIHDVKGGVLISNNLLTDSDINLTKELSISFAEVIEASEEVKFTTGGGANVNEPMGILTDTRVLANFTKQGHATLIDDLDALTDVRYALNKFHRKNAKWLMNSSTEAAIAKLKDTTGRPLWQESFIVGSPNTLMGIPIVNNESMPDVGANAFPIAYANLKNGYKIKDRQGITTKILKERYAEKDMTGILVKKRTGGQVIVPSAFQLLKIAV